MIETYMELLGKFCSVVFGVSALRLPVVVTATIEA